MVRALFRLTVVSFCIASVSLAACKKKSPTEPDPPADTSVPFGGFMVLDGDASDYIEVPHNAALNPTSAMTLEGWIRFESLDCESVIGKNYTQAYWVGACPTLRSYLKGATSAHDGGTFPLGVWTHWAVTSDGSVRRHYVNGALINEVAEAGPLTTSTDPLRIGSDVAWEYAPHAALDEIRLWNVARTQAQIQSTMNTAIKTPTAGLVAVWPLDTNGKAAVGGYDGTVVGTPLFSQE